MSKSLLEYKVDLPAVIEKDPKYTAFVEEVNRRVNEILVEAMAAYEDIDSMPLDDWERLHKELLKLEIKADKDGKILYD